MTQKSKIAVLVGNLVLCVAIILLTAFLMNGWGILVRTVFYLIGGAGIAASAVSLIIKKPAVLKSAFILIILAVIALIAFIVLTEAGNLNDYETDAEKIQGLKSIIEGTGVWGMLVFFLLQVLQVIVLPLPALVCYVPGSLIWGPLTATLLASAGVLAGSVAAYFIGRIWGRKAVIWIAGQEITDKYVSYFGKRGKGIFVLMQILPFFPDDLLCMVAGLTSMNFPFFFFSILIVRPFIIAAYCYLGSGTIIPFTGWGIAVWIAIFAVCIALAVLSFMYQDKFEKWLTSKFKRKNNEPAEEKPKNIQSDEQD